MPHADPVPAPEESPHKPKKAHAVFALLCAKFIFPFTDPYGKRVQKAKHENRDQRNLGGTIRFGTVSPLRVIAMCALLDLNHVEVRRWKDQHETLLKVETNSF